MSSRPDEQKARYAWMSPFAMFHAARAAEASGDAVPGSWEMIAPAAARSSTAGLRVPSGQRSPHAMTAIDLPCPAAYFATAWQLRKQPAITIRPSDWASRVNAEPFGDGRTIRVPSVALGIEEGESENLPVSPRGTASSAPSWPAYSLAFSSFPRQGKTIAPRDTAISTHVENERTSTMINTLLTSPTRRTPESPHSQRISNLDWS